MSCGTKTAPGTLLEPEKEEPSGKTQFTGNQVQTLTREKFSSLDTEKKKVFGAANWMEEDPPWFGFA